MIEIDVSEQVNAVRRQVGARVLEAGQARVVTISQVYGSELEEVWDACTNAERIPRWFLPISGELRVGGRYQLSGNASGTIERCEPPEGFAATWEFGGKVSWIEVSLTVEEPGTTRLQIEHICPVDEHWAEFGPGAVGVGWELAVAGLAGYLRTRAAVDPKDGAAWLASENGREFVRLSARRWCDADIAGGADPTEAQAAADRTAAAYTAG